MDLAQVIGHQQIRKQVMLKGRKAVNLSEMIGNQTVEIAQMEEHYNGLHAALRAMVGRRNERAAKLASLRGGEQPKLPEYEPDKEAGIESLEAYAKALGSALESLDKDIAEEEKKAAEAKAEKAPEPKAQGEAGQEPSSPAAETGDCGSITES